jgi:hypothetical protein
MREVRSQESEFASQQSEYREQRSRVRDKTILTSAFWLLSPGF